MNKRWFMQWTTPKSTLATLSNQGIKRRQSAILVLIVGVLCIVIVTVVTQTTPKRVAPATTTVSDWTLGADALQRAHFITENESRLTGLESQLRALEQSIQKTSTELKSDMKAIESHQASDHEDLKAVTLEMQKGHLKRVAPSKATPTATAPLTTTPYDDTPIKSPLDTPVGAPIAAPTHRLGMVSVPNAELPEETPNSKPLTPVATHPRATQPTTIAAGSYTSAVLLTGVYTATGTDSPSMPMPVVMKLKRTVRLPNGWKTTLDDCLVTGAATGDLSSERVQIRLDRLSCMTPKGQTLDQKVSGYIVGPDGKVGVRGRLITRSGSAIASALSLSVLSGIGKAVSLSSQEVSTSTLTGTQTVDYQNAWKAGLGEGMSEGFDRIVKYYIQLSEKIFPVLELDAGVSVHVVFSQALQFKRNPGDS